MVLEERGISSKKGRIYLLLKDVEALYNNDVFTGLSLSELTFLTKYHTESNLYKTYYVS